MDIENFVITDPVSGAQAQIAAALGFNCHSYRAPLRGKLVETLWTHPEFLAGKQRPSGSGIPILFPFGGRIPGTTFDYQGRQYTLQPGDAQGNAIHGFVMNLPWRVIDASPASVTGEFQLSLDGPAASWPADFRITARYEVSGEGLVADFSVDNPAPEPLPFGLATHAYFRLPPGAEEPSAAEAEQTIVRVPVRGAWELKDLIPTGQRLPIGELAALAEGMPLAGRAFDNVLTDLIYEGGRATTSLANRALGCTLTQTFDDTFRHAIVYTPPHREAICMEPYTALPNPFRLEAAGIQTGFRFLAPGATYRTRIVIALREEG